jgi:hypothetical protein
VERNFATLVLERVSIFTKLAKGGPDKKMGGERRRKKKRRRRLEIYFLRSKL